MSLTNEHKKTLFNINELEFIIKNEICRIATSHNDKPHVVPVCYIYTDNFFYFATDYDTKKYHNLTNNKMICMIIDEYNPTCENKAIMINGSVNFIERGSKFLELYKIFEKKFSWVKKNPWKENEAPFVQIKINTKTSWGL